MVPQADGSKLESFKWLLGDWHIPGTESQYYEHWEAVHDSLYTGTGWVMSGTDTAFFESIALRYQAGTISYTVRSTEDNAEQEVAFTLISDSDNTFIFENTAHDFPQRIVYRHPTPDSLSAYIDGTIDGTYQRSDFPMIRKD